MEGIPLDQDQIKMWQPSQDIVSQYMTNDEVAEERAKQLEVQAAAAQRFHRNGKTPAQRRKQHYATLTSRTARLVWHCWMPVVWITGKVNMRAQWMVIYAQKVSEFWAAHASGPVSPWRLRSRRKECRPCKYRRGKFCGVATCDCGDWKLTELKHVTRLSAVACPKGKWGIGWTRRAYNWVCNLLARRKEL